MGKRHFRKTVIKKKSIKKINARFKKKNKSTHLTCVWSSNNRSIAPILVIKFFLKRI